MDDLQEKEAFDLKNAGQFCYISSWTDDETENIPMWKMYSSLSSGVRIKLKANPFKEFEKWDKSLIKAYKKRKFIKIFIENLYKRRG